MRGCQGSATTLGISWSRSVKCSNFVFALAMTGLLRIAGMLSRIEICLIFPFRPDRHQQRSFRPIVSCGVSGSGMDAANVIGDMVPPQVVYQRSLALSHRSIRQRPQPLSRRELYQQADLLRSSLWQYDQIPVSPTVATGTKAAARTIRRWVRHEKAPKRKWIHKGDESACQYLAEAAVHRER